jgi:hypothetical protein
MIKVHITKKSILYKYRQLGVKERKEAQWRADDKDMPLNHREYDRQFKVITRGLKKRTG